MRTDEPYFVVVTGTDTGVGKTWVTAALARSLSRHGLRVVATKPIETGCAGDADATEDGAILAEATGQEAPREALLRFRAPVAAPVAADLEGASIDLDMLVDSVASFGNDADVVLVEGAGGLCSPLSWEADLVDVAKLIGAGILVVGSDRLGVVNHVALTLNTILGCEADPLGVVLTAPEVADASTGTNAPTLRRVLGDPGDMRAYERVVTVARGDWRDAGDGLDAVVAWIGDERARRARTVEGA
jgi:dethiobiotin synthetase